MSGVGDTYQCSPGTWTGRPTPTLAYQWQRNNGGGYQDIATAVATEYTIQVADTGSQVRCAVTGTNSAGSLTAFSNAVGIVGGPVNTSPPLVTGVFLIGQTVHCDPGTWTGTPAPTYTYQWQRDTQGDGLFVNLVGHIYGNYLVEPETLNCQLRCFVTATNASGQASQPSDPEGPVTEQGIVTGWGQGGWGNEWSEWSGTEERLLMMMGVGS